ncbi:FAD-containing oxidoreductase [Gemelliphila palaticanis]|uniref:FAD-containing oxidoreductase n=1 Tax=Gemelliphila palaticanis TaxID=81950 RepID=A0ABX2T1Z4_9BACL|nr:FAD-containing oxidoreductase [Gemella palaticanis]MBF0715106.1 FAD-containing oxidoreductase [Gemella palaticanis]NYS47036.1 FAD-containing oxidoreductase [Gemella palaticanis]
MKKYDLLVIGFGKAGKTLAVKYASLGKKVAVIEEDNTMYGGTCINIGCIPTKTLIVAANNGDSYEEAKNKRDTVVNKLRSKNFDMLNNNQNVDLYNARAKFKANKIIEISSNNETVELTAEIIVINTGAKTNLLNIKGLTTSNNVVNSTELQKYEKAPKHLGILGAGNIGLEFASLYSKLGTKVTVIDHSDKILAREEEAISKLALEYLENQGVEFKFNSTTEEIFNNGDSVVVKTKEHGELEFDVLLHATGRKPNTENLGLENTNINLTERGAIEVDKFCQTSVENVFAVGDVNGGLQFTYTSLDDYRIVLNYLQGNKDYSLEDRKNVPYTVFIEPPLSRVGLTEKEAAQKGFNIAVKEIPVANMPRGVVNGDTKGLFKAVVDKDSKLILGATLFGKNSEELINIIKMAMDNNITYTYIRDQIFNHPNMAENLNDLFNM